MIEQFLKDTGATVPMIGGAMYPCSNPELVAAVSDARGIGMVQPLSLTFVHGHEFREGLRAIRAMTDKPIGFNALIEKSVKAYEERMVRWVDIALEEGVRFFITAMGNPRWVVERVHAVGGKVYHNTTDRKWSEKALEAGVDGLVLVNNQAGGHAGGISPQELLESMTDLGVPLICAGGIGDAAGYVEALRMGYGGVQMGTRFIASRECTAHEDYKRAIIEAKAKDIVLTTRISGVPVSVIKTPYIEAMGTEAGWLGRRLLQHRKTKHWMRAFYAGRSFLQLRKSNRKGSAYKDFFQAGKSVEGIDAVEPVADIVKRFADAARSEGLL